MSQAAAPAYNFAEADWPEATPIAPERVLSGSPATKSFPITSRGNTKMGFWQVSPGSFVTDHTGYLEFITILEGVGRLVREDGEVTELRPGVTVNMEDGWIGRWEIDETITKVYAVVD